LVVFLILYF
jgi:glutathione S-transferase